MKELERDLTDIKVTLGKVTQVLEEQRRINEMFFKKLDKIEEEVEESSESLVELDKDHSNFKTKVITAYTVGATIGSSAMVGILWFINVSKAMGQ